MNPDHGEPLRLFLKSNPENFGFLYPIRVDNELLMDYLPLASDGFLTTCTADNLLLIYAYANQLLEITKYYDHYTDENNIKFLSGTMYIGKSFYMDKFLIELFHEDIPAKYTAFSFEYKPGSFSRGKLINMNKAVKKGLLSEQLNTIDSIRIFNHNYGHNLQMNETQQLRIYNYDYEYFMTPEFEEMRDIKNEMEKEEAIVKRVLEDYSYLNLGLYKAIRDNNIESLIEIIEDGAIPTLDLVQKMKDKDLEYLLEDNSYVKFSGKEF